MTSPTALDAAASALQAARGLCGAGWDGLADGEALAAAAVLAEVKALVDGALVGVAERIETTTAADTVGWASTKDFLTQVLGGRKGAGGSVVRLAERTRDLPAVRDALTAGAISAAQAGVIAGRVGTLPRDPALRTTAAERMLALVGSEGYDATDLDRCFTTVVAQLDPDGELLRGDLDKDKAERGAHANRFLTLTPDTLGGVRIKGYGTVEDAETIKATLLPLTAPVTSEPGACGGDPGNVSNRDPDTGRRIHPGCPDPGCDHTGRDPRDSSARLFDALLEACRRLQASQDLPLAHATTARIGVTIPLTDLTDPLGREGLLPSGERLSATAVRRLACDADLIPAVLGTEGEVLDVGRTDQPGQPGPALPQAPHPHPPHPLADPPRPPHPPTNLDPTTPHRRHPPLHLPPRPTTTTPRRLNRPGPAVRLRLNGPDVRIAVVPRILRALAAALTLLALAPTAAKADRWGSDDTAEDVHGMTFTPEPAPCGSYVDVDATAEKHTDITGLSVRHHRRSMVVTTRFRALDRRLSNLLLVNVRSSTGGWWLDLHRFRKRDGSWAVSVFLGGEPKFPGPDDIDECGNYGLIIVGEGCRIGRALDYRHDLIRLSVPRRCMGNPSWVRVAASTQRSFAPQDPDAPGYGFFLDEWDGGVELSEWMPPFGPRVRATTGAPIGGRTSTASDERRLAVRRHGEIARR